MFVTRNIFQFFFNCFMTDYYHLPQSNLKIVFLVNPFISRILILITHAFQKQ